MRYSIFNVTSVLVSSGICIPSVCSEEELLWALKHLPNPSWFPLFDATTVECVPKTRLPLPKGGIATVLVISVLATLVLLATIVDLIRRLILKPEQPLADPKVEHFDISHSPANSPIHSRFPSSTLSTSSSSSPIIDSNLSEFGNRQMSPVKSSPTHYSPHEASEDEGMSSSSYMSSDDRDDNHEELESGSKAQASKPSPSVRTPWTAPASLIDNESTTHGNATFGSDDSLEGDSMANDEHEIDAPTSRVSKHLSSHPREKSGDGGSDSQLPPPSNIWMKVLFCFSVAENFERLVKHFPNDKTNLNPLNSIRVIAMFWVLLGHTVLFTIFIGYTNPVQAIHRLLPAVPFQVVLNGTLSVDVFFYLAGFLMAYFTLKELRQRQGRMNWLILVIHRLWRMTPTMLLALFFCWTIVPSLGNGPWWRTFMRWTMAACKKYWWTNVLYINNFWNFDLEQTCLAWSWYMSTDMQFFLVAIPLVYVIYRWPRIGFSILALLSIASLAFVLGMSVSHQFTPIALRMDDGWRKYIYTKPWARFSTFAIGIVGAYLLLDHEQKVSAPHGFRRLPFIPQSVIVALAWAISLVLVLANIFGTLSAYQPGASPWSTARNSAYLTLSRPCFTLGLAIQAHLVMTSRAAVSLKDLLSHPIWTPFARLTFGAYLYHPIVMFGYYFSSYRPIEITGTLIFQNWLAFSVLAFFVSLFSFLLIERPTENLESLLIEYLKHRAKRSKQLQQQQKKKRLNSSVNNDEEDERPDAERPLLVDHHEDV